MHINFEFKARHANIVAAEKKLLQFEPLLVGEDHQVDTYFNVPNGRLKLREGNIEHALIFYERSNSATAKQSNVILYQHKPDTALKVILEKSLGIKTVVDKKRKIYFIDNVKFHFDVVEGLGDKYECNGTLSGSALSMHDAFYNLVTKVGIETEEALRMCALYPARAMRMEYLYGKIAPGFAAQFVVLNKQLKLVDITW